MFSQQLKNGIGLVIEFQCRAAEALGRMTRVTIPGKLFQMHIGVAVIACLWQGFVDCAAVSVFFGMAFLAGNGGVLSGQWKACMVMIECHFFKSFHHVAGLAVRAKLPAMGILTVAIGALGKCDFFVLFPARMALNAGQSAVLAPQWEPGPLMVELGGFEGILIVAGAAVLSEGRLMGIGVAIAAI